MTLKNSLNIVRFGAVDRKILFLFMSRSNRPNFTNVGSILIKFCVQLAHVSTYPWCKYGLVTVILARLRASQRYAKLASKTLDYCSFWAVAQKKNVPIVTSRINIVQG